MISYQDAYEKIIALAAGKHLTDEVVDLNTMVGRILSKDIKAPMTIQPFDNSAMDGFALCVEDVANASAKHPVTLLKQEIIAAGDAPLDTMVTHGHVMHIMTGAVIPKGANAVVPIENVSVDGDKITFSAAVAKHANIRFAGEDFNKGEDVAVRHTKLTSAHILPFASLGLGKIPVFQKPKAVFISTGAELVDDLSKDLEKGQIYNTNRPYIVQKLNEMGLDCISSHTIRDDQAEIFQKILKQAMADDTDLVVSTGAVSMGAFDFVRPELEKMGAKIIFHKIMMKPGKPNLCAVLPNGTVYFGLPGNPVSSAVGVRFFVQPYVDALLAAQPEQPVMAVAQNTFSKRQGMRIFAKASLSHDETGQAQVTFLDGQASFMVKPFFAMNAWAICAEDKNQINAGDMVPVYTL